MSNHSFWSPKRNHGRLSYWSKAETQYNGTWAPFGAGMTLYTPGDAVESRYGYYLPVYSHEKLDENGDPYYVLKSATFGLRWGPAQGSNYSGWAYEHGGGSQGGGVQGGYENVPLSYSSRVPVDTAVEANGNSSNWLSVYLLKTGIAWASSKPSVLYVSPMPELHQPRGGAWIAYQNSSGYTRRRVPTTGNEMAIRLSAGLTTVGCEFKAQLEYDQALDVEVRSAQMAAIGSSVDATLFSWGYGSTLAIAARIET